VDGIGPAAPINGVGEFDVLRRNASVDDCTEHLGLVRHGAVVWVPPNTQRVWQTV
jgi:hypothetical protein